MATFQEDMIFKNIGEKDIDILLEMVGKESKTRKIWTTELRQIDPTTYKPDLIIELDDENLIIEFQSTETNDNFSKRANVYVGITTLKKINNKKVNLAVISTAEKSKIVLYQVNDLSIFGYKVIGNDLFDGEKIINEIKEKYNYNIPISKKEIIYFSLAPLMTKNGNLEKNIKKTIDLLVKIEDVPLSTKNLCFSIEWLLTDKYVKDERLRNLLLDMLGDKMSAILEYGKRKEEKGKLEGKLEGELKGKKEIILRLLNRGMNIKEISTNTGIEVKDIEKIINPYQVNDN